uniref:Uncharacterized protein n=1 Tax=Pygocentrus nattereri TaxID=42514 RepID=A0A3B4CIM4_PYGNA
MGLNKHFKIYYTDHHILFYYLFHYYLINVDIRLFNCYSANLANRCFVRFLTNQCSVRATEGVPGSHHFFDTLHLLLVAAPVLHGTLLCLLQCIFQCPNSLSCRVSPLRQRLSSASSLWMLSFRLLFFSFSFSYFLFHCSAVSSRFTDAVFLMVLALGS